MLRSVSRAELIMYYNDYNLHTQIIPIPPWKIPEISVNWDLLSQTDKIYSPLQTKIITREYIDRYSGYLNIFTDGSKQSNNCTASAVYIPYFHVQISRKIPDLCSVYTAELIALLLALDWIRDVKPSNSVIFTDSLSALGALQNPIEHINNNAIIKEIIVILYELFSNQIKVIFIVAFLENATIGYSLESLCVCVFVCVCVFLHDNSKRNQSRNTKLEYIVVYENSSDEFDSELHRINVKVTVGVQTFSPFTTIQTVRSYSSTLVQARNLILSFYLHLILIYKIYECRHA